MEHEMGPKNPEAYGGIIRPELSAEERTVFAAGEMYRLSSSSEQSLLVIEDLREAESEAWQPRSLNARSKHTRRLERARHIMTGSLATEQAAFKHPLTDAFTRRALEQQLFLEAIQWTQRQNEVNDDNSGIAIFYLDVDGFKAINDTHGHLAGDKVLISIADRLSANIRLTDRVVHLGGDEFLVLVSALRKDSVPKKSARILEALSQPIHISDGENNIEISTSVSHGDYFLGKDDLSSLISAIKDQPTEDRHQIIKTLLDNVLHFADQDMYKVKKLRQIPRSPATTNAETLPDQPVE